MTCLFRMLLIGCALTAAAPAVYAQQSAPSPSDVRRLSIDDVVRLALANNLGIQVARLNPQIEDLSVAMARAGWTPSVNSTFESVSTETPSTSFLSGGQSGISDKRVTGNVGVGQALLVAP